MHTTSRPLMLWVAAAIASLAVILPIGSALPAGKRPPSLPRRESKPPSGKIMLVVIDRISLDDIAGADLPTIGRLLEEGSVALMNARARYDVYGQGSYVLIGAGGRAFGGTQAGLAFGKNERMKAAGGDSFAAGDVYTSRTGRTAPTGSIVNLSIEEMKKLSETDRATSTPGLLGQVLRDGHRKAALVGNADSIMPGAAGFVTFQPGSQDQPILPQDEALGEYPAATSIHREASCIAMDENGLVPAGSVSSALDSRQSNAGEISTNWGRLFSDAARYLPSSDLLVVDLGQTSRVDEQAAYYSDAAIVAARASALEKCDEALGRLVELLDPRRDLLVVCTPTPTRKMIEDGSLLTPLIIVGPGFGPGQISSDTTKRSGVVSNFDIAPTIAKHLGLDTPAEMEGRPLSHSGNSSDIEGLQRFQKKSVGASTSRKTLVRVYAVYVLVVIGLLVLMLLLRDDLVWKHRFLWWLPLMAALAGPLAFLVAPVLAGTHLSLVVLVPLCAVLSVVFGLAAASLRGREKDDDGNRGMRSLARPVLTLSGVTLFLVLLDLLLGSPMMSLSPFGSDVILGDRYYGIGNFYMGVALGAAILTACLSLELFGSFFDRPWKRYSFVGAVLLITTFFIGFPKIGAEVGGLITGVVAALVVLVKLEGGRLTLKKAVLIVVILALCIAALLAAEAFIPALKTHAGKAVSRAGAQGATSVFQTIGRKLAANWSLSNNSILRFVVLFALVGVLLVNWRFAILGRIRGESPYLWVGYAGMLTAFVVAWVFNDSGIEPAAALSILMVLPLLLRLVDAGGNPSRATGENE